jgi:hypothetical protein
MFLMQSNNSLYKLYKAGYRVPVPTTGDTIYVSKQDTCVPVITGSGAFALTLARPLKDNIRCIVLLDTNGGGNLTLTVTGGYNAEGSTTILFNTAGDFVTFVSIRCGTTYSWRVLSQEGTAVPAEHGAGAIGTGAALVTHRYSQYGKIITEIKVDLQGLASVATANDAIGLAAGGAAKIGQYVVATCGVVYQIELICLETPAGGDNDVNVVLAASGTIAYDGAGGTTYGVNGGDAVAGQVIQNLVQGLTDTYYLYLTAGTGDTAAAYTAGMFIVRLTGHPVLA